MSCQVVKVGWLVGIISHFWDKTPAINTLRGGGPPDVFRGFNPMVGRFEITLVSSVRIQEGATARQSSPSFFPTWPHIPPLPTSDIILWIYWVTNLLTRSTDLESNHFSNANQLEAKAPALWLWVTFYDHTLPDSISPLQVIVASLQTFLPESLPPFMTIPEDTLEF